MRYRRLSAEHTVFVLKDKRDRAEAHRKFLQETAERKQREYESASQYLTKPQLRMTSRRHFGRRGKSWIKLLRLVSQLRLASVRVCTLMMVLQMLDSTMRKWSRCTRNACFDNLEVHLPRRVKAKSSSSKSSPDQHADETAPLPPPFTCARMSNKSCGRCSHGLQKPLLWWFGSAPSIAIKKRHSRGLLGNLSVGDKEGIFSDGWTVVKKKQKTKKKLLCPQSMVSGVLNCSSRDPICKSGTKSSLGLNISGPRCSQIQMGFNASPFSGQNTSVSASANKNVHPILNDFRRSQP